MAAPKVIFDTMENGQAFRDILGVIIIYVALGLYEPQQGSILIDGIDRKEYALESLKNYMSAVFQDYKIFAMQIDENIALGQEIAEDKLQEAMRKGGIEEKVNSLEKKSKSVIGVFLIMAICFFREGNPRRLQCPDRFIGKRMFSF